MILGLHCSIRKSYLDALAHATHLACGAMQIFSYRRHDEPSGQQLEEFSIARRKSQVSRLLVHVRYLPFLASTQAERHLHSVRLLAREIRLAKQLGAEGLVLHAGAYSIGADAHSGLARFAQGVEQAYQQAQAEMPILIENVPGGGRRMGGSLEEIAELGELLNRSSIPSGFCLDTAHAWAQGYDIAAGEGMWKFIGAAHHILGADRIKAFHLNDTRALLGSHREHHWHWGQGYLGAEGLKTLLGRAEFKDTMGILETPSGEDNANLALVRGLADSNRPA